MSDYVETGVAGFARRIHDGKIETCFTVRVAMMPAPASKKRRGLFPFRVLTGENLWELSED
jgi:hypothetical protein